MRQRVTLSDVAKKSGVSISTVSLVLRNKPGIPPGTRQRVLDAVKKLNYKPKSSMARHYAAHSPLRTLGLVIKSEPDMPPRANPFYSHVMAGIEDACRQRKINLLYSMLPVNGNNHPVQVPRLLLEGGVEGLLVVGAFVDSALAPVLEQGAVPIVLVDAYAESGRYDAVVSDNLNGACQAVSHLIQCGHRHIGLVGGHPNAYPSIRERREGYLQALRNNGLSETYLADCASQDEAVFEAATSLLRQQPQVTAVFGCNDQTAITAMRAAQALGRRTPEEFSIVGFDDIDQAQHITPTLTTMHVDKVNMGRAAVQLSVNRIEVPESAQMTFVIHPTLVERQSVVRLPSI